MFLVAERCALIITMVLCEFENIDALQKSVIKVISDEKNFKKMSANSRKLAIKNFDINIINKKIIQEIEVFF